MPRYIEPAPEQQLLLAKLGVQLPQQPPQKISPMQKRPRHRIRGGKPLIDHAFTVQAFARGWAREPSLVPKCGGWAKKRPAPATLTILCLTRLNISSRRRSRWLNKIFPPDRYSPTSPTVDISIEKQHPR